MRPSSATTICAGLGLWTLGLTACGDMLPQAALLDSVRPLAARIVVTEPIVPETDPTAATRAQALPFETVEITPLIGGPGGVVDASSLAPVWYACPLGPTQSLYGCISSEFPIAPDAIPECVAPSLNVNLNFGDIPPAQGLCTLGSGATATLSIPFDFNILSGGGIEVTMIAGIPGGTSTETCAEVLLSGDISVPDDCVLLIQRVTVGPLERLFELAGQFGAEIPPEFLPDDPGLIPDFDRNPRIESVGVQRLTEPGVEPTTPNEIIPPDGVVSADYGDVMRFNTIAPIEDLQTFNVVSADGEVREEQEAYRGAWYRTWGRLQSGASNDPLSFNEFELVEGSQDTAELPEDDRVEFIYVLRDGRGGVDWRTWRVEASPLP